MGRVYVEHCCEELRCILPSLNVLVAVNKGVRAVELCSNKILQFLARDAS